MYLFNTFLAPNKEDLKDYGKVSIWYTLAYF